ncbi:signal peptidase IB [Peptoniphilus sp. ING2-D1G]|nr:signal peptidase IB [Peptoniphilus sp. ING2-D1G]
MKEKKESLMNYIFMFAIAIILALLIRHFVFTSNIVSGVSMEPSFQNNDRLIALVFPLYLKDPEYSDVVIIESPIEENKEYIKRIIAKPRDNVLIENGSVYVNGNKLNEPYIEQGVETQIYNDFFWTLDENQYFVLGDNRNPGKSSDSRVFGPIEREAIKGIVKFRFWPLSKFGVIGG